MKKRSRSLIGVLASIGILASAGLSASADAQDANRFSLLAGGGVTTGALNTLFGDIGAGGAITTGAGTSVTGNLYANDAITTGAGTNVYGNLSAGGAITTGAGTYVRGTFIAGSAIVLGAGTSGANPPLLGAATIAKGNAKAKDIDLNLYTTQMAAFSDDLAVKMARGTDLDADKRSVTTAVTTDRELGAKTLKAGVYTTETFFTLSGTLTLDGEHNENSVFIIRTPKYISASAGGSVVLINGASAENVFFVTGSYFSAGAGAKLQGNIMATSYATLGAGSTFDGSIFSRDGYITLGANVVQD